MSAAEELNMDHFKSTVTSGRQLKAARTIVGLTIREMADAAGLNHNTITRVERLETLPYHASAADLMAATLQEMGIVFTAGDGRAGVSFSVATMRKRSRPLPV